MKEGALLLGLPDEVSGFPDTRVCGPVNKAYVTRLRPWNALTAPTIRMSRGAFIGQWRLYPD